MTVCSIKFLNFKINKLVQRRNFPGNLTVIYLKFDSSAPCGLTEQMHLTASTHEETKELGIVPGTSPLIVVFT